MKDDLLEALTDIKNLRRIMYDHKIERYVNINGHFVDINHIFAILKDHYKTEINEHT